MKKFLMLILFTFTCLYSLKAQSDSADTVYTFPEASPEFPGGEEALMSYLGDFPADLSMALEDDSKSKLVISFIVRRDGTGGWF